jgi:hypothetical protein
LIPDLSIYETPQYPNEILHVDVTVVQSFIGSNNPLDEVNLKSRLPNKFFTKLINNRNDNCREGHRAEIAKNFKYFQTAANNNSKFLAFVMETNGYINENGVLLLKSLAKKASTIHSIPENSLLKFFKTLLSVTLQKSISEQIINHTARINTPFYNPDQIDIIYQNIMDYNHNFN